MSFSFSTKNELCRALPERSCCCMAECYGVLLYCNTFSAREIRIKTGNADLGQRLKALFDRAFGIAFDAYPSLALNSDRAGKHTYLINSPEKLAHIFETYGFMKETLVAHHVNLGVLEEDCCRRSFIRGAFLAGGTITDPLKSYHLELVTDHYNVSREIFSLLLEMDFSPKDTSHNGNYITYFKQSSAIEDFLTLIGAPLAAMEVMTARIEKEIRNAVNRKVNCDTANVTKTVDASAAQIDAIMMIEAAGAFETLPEKLRQTAELRLNNPELSIKELADISTPPVTKSCLNHRLRKLSELAATLS